MTAHKGTTHQRRLTNQQSWVENRLHLIREPPISKAGCYKTDFRTARHGTGWKPMRFLITAPWPICTPFRGSLALCLPDCLIIRLPGCIGWTP